MSVIDFGELGKHITALETYFKKNNLNITEQKLLLQETAKRINSKIEKQNISDQLYNLPLNSILDKFMKGKKYE